MKVKSQPSWPTGPRPLVKYDGLGWLSLVGDILVTLSPLAFLVLGISALYLEGRPRSQFGENLIEASKYGTTAFPIIFAAVAARMMRALALKFSERGATLGMLEQLVGSQSLATTVQRFFLLRQFNVFGFLVILTWLISPFGSQMTLRLLSMKDSNESYELGIQYFNATGGDGSVFELEDKIAAHRPALSALLGATVLSSEQVRTSPVDPWGNFKIPLLTTVSEQTQIVTNPWIDVQGGNASAWVSLSGLMTVGVPVDGQSTFEVESSYFDAKCPDSVSFQINGDNARDRLKEEGYALTTNNSSGPWGEGGAGWNSAFLDTLQEDFPTPSSAALNIMYGSIAASNLSQAFYDRMEVYNCSITPIRIEAQVACDKRSCSVKAIRKSGKDNAMALGSTTYHSMLSLIPNLLGAPAVGYTSPLDQLMMGADNPFSPGMDAYMQNYGLIPGAEFEKRLTLLFNTVFQISLCPYAIQLGSSANLAYCNPDSGVSQRTAKTLADTVTVTPQARYVTYRWHAIVLVVLSILLQIAAIATMIIIMLTNAPNIFGFVSTMTRDNPYTVVPPGGVTLDGADRARYLSKTVVRIADAMPEAECGHIAFCTVESDRPIGRLKKGRLYV